MIPGVSRCIYIDRELDKIKPEANQVTFDGIMYDGYTATQMQRCIESAIRKTKRELAGYDAANDAEAFTTQSVKLRQQKELYADFSKAAGLPLQNERAWVLGYGHSVSQKAVWAEKKFTKAQEHAKILAEIKEKAGIRGELHIPARNIDINKLSFDGTHINGERRRDITLEEAKAFIKTAKASVTVWRGKFERYYSEKGVSYVDIEQCRIRTAFRHEQFSDDVRKILEELNKHGY